MVSGVHVSYPKISDLLRHKTCVKIVVRYMYHSIYNNYEFIKISSRQCTMRFISKLFSLAF